MTTNTTQTDARFPAPAIAVPVQPDPAGPAASRRPRITPAGTRPGSSAPAADVVLAYLRIHADTLVSLEPLVRADQPDAVHQMRVATRRLRAARPRHRRWM